MWQRDVGQGFSGPAVAAGGRLYARSKDKLVCVDLRQTTPPPY